MLRFNEILRIVKYNPYHDEKGRFTTRTGARARSNSKPEVTNPIPDYELSVLDKKIRREAVIDRLKMSGLNVITPKDMPAGWSKEVGLKEPPAEVSEDFIIVADGAVSAIMDARKRAGPEMKAVLEDVSLIFGQPRKGAKNESATQMFISGTDGKGRPRTYIYISTSRLEDYPKKDWEEPYSFSAMLAKEMYDSNTEREESIFQSARAITTHEIGHVLDYKSEDQLGNFTFKSTRTYINKEGISLKSDPRIFISRYAYVNRAEMFAETYARYHTWGPERMPEASKKTIALMNMVERG